MVTSSSSSVKTSSKLIPFTTTFKPAATCTEDFYVISTNTPFNGDHYVFIGGPSPSGCFPSGWASTSQYFSPGLCPIGYTQACASLDATGTFTETQATCCPSGYVCYTQTMFNFPGQACVSSFPSIITTAVTYAANLSTETTIFRPGTQAVNGYGVSIRYARTDAISSTLASSKATATSKTATSTSTTPSLPTSASNPSSGLSTGARAGIAVGITMFVVVAIAALAFFFLRRRSRKPASGYEISRDTTYKSIPSPRAGVHEIYTHPSPVELDATPRS